MTRDDMKDWIKKLCPEIAGWQVDLIVEQVDLAVAAEREACAEVCERISKEFVFEPRSPDPVYCADAIRARGESK